MRLTGRRKHLRLEFDPLERSVLTSLFGELRGGYDDPGTDDGNRRLFPPAYPDDERAGAEFRELTQASLVELKIGRLEGCLGDLAGESIDLSDPEIRTRWLTALNDLRLQLGTRLDISEDDDPTADLVDDDHQLYYWLTAVQDALVQSAMR